jgi:hypothetical protein
MSPEFQTQLQSLVDRLSRGKLKDRTCVQIMGLLLTHPNARTRYTDSLRDVRARNIRITGARATGDVVLTAKGRTITQQLGANRSGGKWLINCCLQRATVDHSG